VPLQRPKSGKAAGLSGMETDVGAFWRRRCTVGDRSL
jgi:hypothetical protein